VRLDANVKNTTNIYVCVCVCVCVCNADFQLCVLVKTKMCCLNTEIFFCKTLFKYTKKIKEYVVQSIVFWTRRQMVGSKKQRLKFCVVVNDNQCIKQWKSWDSLLLSIT